MNLPSVARRGLPALALLTAAGIGACGSGEADELASFAPPDAPVYVEGAIRPEGEQADAITALADKLGGVSDPGSEVIGQIDEALGDGGSDLSYAEDIEPWLGTRAAVFVTSLEGAESGEPDAASVVETTDADAASAFADKAAADNGEELTDSSYEGVDYKLDESGVAVGVVDDFLVTGTEDAFKAAVDTSGGDSLADSDDFTADSEELGADDALLSAYVDPVAALDAAAAADSTVDPEAIRSAAGEALEQPVAMALTATEDAVAIEASAAASEVSLTGTAALIESLPGEPWFAFGLEDAGAALRQGIESFESQAAAIGATGAAGPGAVSGQLEAATGLDLDEDVLSAIGSLAVYVSGTSEDDLRAGVNVSVSDSQAAGRSLDSLTKLLEDQGLSVGPPPGGADDGFTATVERARVEAALTGEELTISVTGADAPAASGTLGDSDAYASATDALGDEYEPQAFLGFRDLFAFAESTGATTSPDYQAAKPYTENLTYAITGARTEEDRTFSRFVIGVE
jgi:hypothetical protein